MSDGMVVDQVAALPGEALKFYLQVLDVLELAPWNGHPYNDVKPDGNMRQLVFGDGGVGVVTYLILEDQQRVDVLEVTWVG
jgi:hypothetical protein